MQNCFKKEQANGRNVLPFLEYTRATGRYLGALSSPVIRQTTLFVPRRFGVFAGRFIPSWSPVRFAPFSPFIARQLVYGSRSVSDDNLKEYKKGRGEK